jgi:hypothetical protein
LKVSEVEYIKYRFGPFLLRLPAHSTVAFTSWIDQSKDDFAKARAPPPSPPSSAPSRQRLRRRKRPLRLLRPAPSASARSGGLAATGRADTSPDRSIEDMVEEERAKAGDAASRDLLRPDAPKE